LQPGGVALVTVPAGMALWSDWDVALHHYRATRAAALRAVSAAQWELLHVNYTNVAVYRRSGSCASGEVVSAGRGEARSEDKLPPPWLNALLRWLFVRLAFWRLPFPFGVSLLLVARRR